MTSVLSNRKVKFSLSAFAVAAATLAANVPAHASLALTPAGVAAGFTLTNYASGGSGGAYNFLAASVLSDGNLAVVDYTSSTLRKYADVNGQTPGSFLASKALSGVVNTANAGGKAYASTLGGTSLYQIDSALVLTPIAVSGITFGYGLAGNPVTGHLVAAGNGSGIYDINLGTGTATLVPGTNTMFFDGVSVSADGSTVYGASGSSVLGFNITSGASVFTYNAPGGTGPDGTGVIYGGLYNGYIVSNNNNGTITLIDPTGTSVTIIASGGSRGDFTSPDSNNGTLLLAFYGEMWRLSAPGGSFTTPAPEPASITLCGILVGSMATFGWCRRKLGRQS